MENIFTKIKDKTIDAHIVYEDQAAILIEDINKQKKYHFLLLPKQNVTDFAHLIEIGSEHYVSFMASLSGALEHLRQSIGLTQYNIIINNGPDAGQEIMHLHIHILAD